MNSDRRHARRGGRLADVTIVIEVVDEPEPDDVQRLVRSLVAWNSTVAPPEDHRKLAVFAYDTSEMVGGAAGYTHWGWLFVSHLWVSDERRGEGLGSRLMRGIESTAVRRGAKMAHLDTYDFQALQFYERLGYEQFAELQDYPPGNSRHFLRKRLL
jgi:GNAT superfamily N-acetyltransferase